MSVQHRPKGCNSTAIWTDRERGDAGYTLIEILVCSLIVGILSVLILPAVQAAREASRRVACANNFHMLGLALQNYLSETNFFPPIVSQTDFGSGSGSSGPSAHSYSPLARMLPHLDQSVLFNATNFTNIPDFPVGVVQNSTVMKCTLNVALCPSDAQPSVPGFGRTNVRFSVGPTHTLAPGSSKPDSFLGPFTTHFAYRAADFQDGLSNTVGLSERLQGDWMNGPFKMGGDYYLNTPWVSRVFDCAKAITACEAVSTAARVDSRGGETWFLSGFHSTNFNHCVSPNSRTKSCALDDAREPLHDRMIHAGIFGATSGHGSGVNVCCMDGSVRFLTSGINVNVWRALGTRSSGEIVSAGE